MPASAKADVLRRRESGAVPRKKVHRAGGAFIHRLRWLSDWALRPSPYDLRKRLRLTRAPYSVQAAHYKIANAMQERPMAEMRKERTNLSVDRLRSYSVTTDDACRPVRLSFSFLPLAF